MRALRPWHWLVVAALSLLALLLLWVGIAYGGLPRLWSRHEHKRIGRRDELISYTAQDIPADPINLRLKGDAAAIGCAFDRAGWTLADNVSVRSAVKIAASVVLHRAYPAAPVSSLYVHDKVQDLAYQLDEGSSADRRHHVRLWQVAPGDWLAAATYDRGVGLSLFTLQITHHIGRDVDAERAAIGTLVTASGARLLGTESSRLPPGKWHRNGGGDRYRTDGLIQIYSLGSGCAHR
ncbi:LssY C-terminal domain-containing protein [Sphingomonas bacterium]|uniref:LssY C-terminal domain-containing protein n=1 Tax=Sphingomonas bacterium TaxID=1895847 RepID=UPI001576FBD5|nr:LssY C-terminal domain-containing protein [Sphingomonas bacterium]